MTSVVALIIVVALIAVSMGVAIFTRRSARTSSEFYVAGQNISWLQNALALTGDYLSAASFLGVAGAIAIFGIDKTWDGLGYFGGYIVLLTLLAVPLRKVGKYTTSEILTTRFKGSRSLRFSGMMGAVVISTFYVVPQIVGAGALLQLLMGWNFTFSVLVIGALVIGYVTTGGMRATTYNQIIQGLVLWGAMFIIMILMLGAAFGFNPGEVLSQANDMIPPKLASGLLANDPSVPDFATLTSDQAIAFVSGKLTGQNTALTPGTFAPNWMNTMALAAGLVFGTAGLPHVLTRYYTVKRPKDARTSTIGVLLMIGSFYIMTVFVGLGAMYILYPDLMGYFLGGKSAIAQNMAVPLLAEHTGGEIMLGVAIGGAFCAILSTVAGLLITIGTTVSHDFYKEVINRNATDRREVGVAKLSIVIMGVMAVGISLGMADQNVSYLVTLAFGMAASIFFPVLFMSIWWKRYTRQGALATMAAGLIVSVVFVVATLTGVESVLGLPVLVNPALYSLPAAIIAGVLVSLVTKDVGDVDNFMRRAHSKTD
jgi:cation/acetate symporter